MPRAGRSSVWWLSAVGLLAFLLTASKARALNDVFLACGSGEVADPGEAPRVRIGIVVAAAALCVLLAVAVVAVLQVNQKREDRDVAQALTGGDPTKAAALATRFGCAGCHTISWITRCPWSGRRAARGAAQSSSIWRAWCATPPTIWCNGSSIRRRCRRTRPCRSPEFRDAKPPTWPPIFTPTDHDGRSGERFGVGRAGSDLR